MAGRGQKAAGAAVRVRSEERDEGKERQTFKVRCALTNAFYMFVEAHDSDEAELIAERFCEEKSEKDDRFWDSEASYKHSTFEAEET